MPIGDGCSLLAKMGELVLMQSGDRPPLAEAMEWASKVMAIVVVMVLPGLAGQWLDKKLGTGFIVFVGFAFGLTMGMYCLLVMTGAERGGRGDGGDGDGQGGE